MTSSQIIFAIIIVFFLALIVGFRFFRGSGSAVENEHADVNRFARLLVSEIKLYEFEKVQRGLKANDLLGSLENEIAVARKKFRSRFRRRSELEPIFDETMVELLGESAVGHSE